MTSPIRYKDAYQRQRRKNISYIIDNINTPDIQKRIAKYSKKHGSHLKRSEITAILEDDHNPKMKNFIATQISTDPMKQSIHERTALRWIRRNFPSLECQKLPNNGPNSQYIHYHKVGTINDEDDIVQNCKSIDFIGKIRIKRREYPIYICHKYTSNNGGSQDNQLQDALLFIQAALNYRGNHALFIVLADGDYYQTKHPLGYNNRIDYLNAYIPKNINTIKAISSDQLKDFLREVQKNGFNPAINHIQSKEFVVA